MRTKRAFKMKWKAFFINFKGLSVKQIPQFFLEVESPSLNSKSFKSILIWNSLIAGLNRYCKIWSNFFKPIDALNSDIGMDKRQNVLWWVQNLPIFPWKMPSFCAAPTIYIRILQRILLMVLDIVLMFLVVGYSLVIIVPL